MKILVCGGREYDDWPRLKEKLDELHLEKGVSEVIHGSAQGADRLAGVWARWNNIPERPYPANWKQYGKRAGYVRNSQMLEEGKPDVVVVFKGGSGTEMMYELSKKAGIPTIDYR